MLSTGRGVTLHINTAAVKHLSSGMGYGQVCARRGEADGEALGRSFTPRQVPEAGEGS